MLSRATFAQPFQMTFGGGQLRGAQGSLLRDQLAGDSDIVPARKARKRLRDAVPSTGGYAAAGTCGSEIAPATRTRTRSALPGR